MSQPDSQVSDYNYRNVCTTVMPIGWERAGASNNFFQAIGGSPNGPYFADHSLAIAQTSPEVFTQPGSPQFKTQKLLGSRAIVSDSFSHHQQIWGLPTIDPGRGNEAHRDGYNVLYGDWSVSWYGDPQQRIMWWKHSRWHPSVITWLQGNLWLALENANIGNSPTVQDGYPYCYPDRTSSQVVWHIFDEAHGVDTGVEPYGFDSIIPF